MNSCGVNIPRILNTFIDNPDDIQDIIEEYYFSKWYPLIKDYSPKSFIFKQSDLFLLIDSDLTDVIKMNECFARMESCSAKPLGPYTSIAEILSSLSTSDRTREDFIKGGDIVIREYLNIKDEFRCFVHDKVLRGITYAPKNIKKHIKEIKEIIKRFDYDDFVIDFGFAPELIVIEINTPVYLCATSGDFNLDSPYDYEVLLGDYKPDIINYPVIRFK